MPATAAPATAQPAAPPPVDVVRVLPQQAHLAYGRCDETIRFPHLEGNLRPDVLRAINAELKRLAFEQAPGPFSLVEIERGNPGREAATNCKDSVMLTNVDYDARRLAGGLLAFHFVIFDRSESMAGRASYCPIVDPATGEFTLLLSALDAQALREVNRLAIEALRRIVDDPANKLMRDLWPHTDEELALYGVMDPRTAELCVDTDGVTDEFPGASNTTPPHPKIAFDVFARLLKPGKIRDGLMQGAPVGDE